jgi:hypothetical protein
MASVAPLVRRTEPPVGHDLCDSLSDELRELARLTHH